MNVGGIVCGVIAAVIGAVVWAAVAFYANVEIGYLAWGIGLLVGLGVSLGSRTGGVGAALVAVVLTALSILGGKYVGVRMAVERGFQEAMEEFQVDDDFIVMGFAANAVADAEAAGKRFKFRNGANSETASSLEDYPQEIVEQAKAEFGSLTEQEQREAIEVADNYMQEALAGGVNEGFMASFSPFDLLFFGLGIFTAAKVALSDVIRD